MLGTQRKTTENCALDSDMRGNTRVLCLSGADVQARSPRLAQCACERKLQNGQFADRLQITKRVGPGLLQEGAGHERERIAVRAAQESAHEARGHAEDTGDLHPTPRVPSSLEASLVGRQAATEDNGPALGHCLLTARPVYPRLSDVTALGISLRRRGKKSLKVEREHREPTLSGQTFNATA